MTEEPERSIVGVSMDVGCAQAVLDAPNVWTPCREDPSGWDIDRSDALGLWAAVRACRMDCPLFDACRVVAETGRVSLRSMVWAGVVYDERGRKIDLNKPRLRIGPYTMADTRIPDAVGRIYNGHTGRWEHPPTEPGPARTR